MQFLIKICLVVLVLWLNIPSYLKLLLILLLIGYDLITSFIKILVMILVILVFFYYKGWGATDNFELNTFENPQILICLSNNQVLKIFASKIAYKDNITIINNFKLQLLEENSLIATMESSHAQFENQIFIIDKPLKITYKLINIFANNAILNINNSTLHLNNYQMIFDKYKINSNKATINLKNDNFVFEKPLMKLENLH
jgi:hypothetical protein